MSTISIRGYNATNNYVHTNRPRLMYRSVFTAGGVGETNGCVTSTADRVQSFHRGFHGLIFSPESSLANRFLIPCLSVRIPEFVSVARNRTVETFYLIHGKIIISQKSLQESLQNGFYSRVVDET